jgi:hypothetical protein
MIPKKLIALIFFAALALATTGVLRAQGNPDSGKSPWKLPFEIYLSASYEVNSFEDYLNENTFRYDTILWDDTAQSSTSISIFVDSNSLYSFAQDTLNYVRGSYLTFGSYVTQGNESLSIIFVPGHDSISSLTYSYDTSLTSDEIPFPSFQDGYTFTLSGLRFDDSSIFCPDRSLSHAQFSLSNNEGYLSNYDGRSEPDQIHSNAIKTLSVTLGGLFQAITLSTPASVSMSARNSNVSFQSFPNPFSQSTTISFTPETSGYADISIVNLLGAEVTHLFSGELAAGPHSFVWSNPTGLPDGTYECLIRMNGQVQTLPMVLMR